jgi:hypothetical protein
MQPQHSSSPNERPEQESSHMVVQSVGSGRVPTTALLAARTPEPCHPVWRCTLNVLARGRGALYANVSPHLISFDHGVICTIGRWTRGSMSRRQGSNPQFLACQLRRKAMMRSGSCGHGSASRSVRSSWLRCDCSPEPLRRTTGITQSAGLRTCGEELDQYLHLRTWSVM